jgi:hypothetical protein
MLSRRLFLAIQPFAYLRRAPENAVTGPTFELCRFNPTAAGTGDFTYSSTVAGYRSPAAAGAVNGAVYHYRAESGDLSQWELGFGA